MNPTNDPTAMLDVEHESPSEIVDALQAMLSDVDGFMVDWFQRLNQQLVACDTVFSPDQKVRQQSERLRREQNEWNLKRDREDEQIQEKFQQLTDAWLRLESEQRKFLQLKNARASVSGESPPQHALAQNALAQATESIDARATHSPAVAVKPIPTQSVPGSPDRQSPEPSSSEHAIRQFQRLRQEIQSSQKF